MRSSGLLLVALALTVLDAGAQRPVIVDNAAPNPDAPAFRLSPHPVLTAGGAADDPNYDVTFLGKVEVTRGGKLLVAPNTGGRGRGALSVQVFGPGGRFERAVGRNGAGPGDFRQVSAIWMMSGDTVAVHDDILNRLTIFDPAGKLVRTIANVPRGHCCFDDLSYLTPRTLTFFQARDNLGPRDSITWMLGRAGTAEAPRHALTVEWSDPAVWITREVVRDNQRVGTSMNISTTVPFAREASLEISASSIIHGMPDTYEYRVYSPTGTLLRTVRAAVPVRPVTREMIALVRETAGPTDPALRAAFRARFDQLTLPRTLPAYAGLQVERDGTVWVRGYDAPGVTRNWWARFDPDGRLLGTLVIPPQFMVRRFSNGHVILSRHEADGFTRLFVHRVEPVSG